MAKTRTPRVNLKHIADSLGLSTATVSRALRGVPGINQETREKIVQQARTLGYPLTPLSSSAAQPGKLLLILSQCASPGVDQRYLAGISEASVDYNASILSHWVNPDACAKVIDPQFAPPALRSGTAHGLILLHRWPLEVATNLAARFPTVSIIHEYPGAAIDLIGLDDRHGVDSAVQHFYAGGHRKIGFFGLCPEVSWSRTRYSAFVGALARLDLPFSAANVVELDLPSALAVQEFPSADWAQQVRSRIGAGVDAWFCPSAMTGQTLYRFLLKQGLRLPEDVAIANYHGGSHPGLSDLAAITTTDVVDEELGATAVRRLIQRLEHRNESHRSILLQTRLIPRATTRPVPSPA